MPTPDDRADIVVSGASHVGAAFALASVTAEGAGLDVVLVDPADIAREPDVRTFAISAASRNLLDAIGVWRVIEPEAQPVVEIEITDPKSGSSLREPMLKYDNRLRDGSAAMSIVEADVLRRALAQRLTEVAGIRRVEGQVKAVDPSLGGCVVTLKHGGTFGARLVAVAEGRRSATREAAGIRGVGWSYNQASIVTVVGHERAHGGKALQHFFAGGPFAVLPLVDGHRSGIVWTESADEANRLMALDDTEFIEALSERLGPSLGAVRFACPRQMHPLSLQLANRLTGPRIALLGDSARGMHPIAGQGLNLAFRDAAALAEVVVTRARLGLDIGDAMALATYQRRRGFDGAQSALAMDGINRVFAGDSDLTRSLRDFGLNVVDRLPLVKRLLVEEAAGLTGEVPKLLKGIQL